MSLIKIYVIEDDMFYARYLKHHLSLNVDNEVDIFNSGKDVLKGGLDRPDIITLDYSLPDIDGLTLLSDLQTRWKNVPIIVISGQQEVSTAVKLLKKGAYDYIVKDDDTKDRLWAIINRIRENVGLRDQLERLQAEVDAQYDFTKIIGNSPVMQRIFDMMKKGARSNITVSITGETGTGKELAAKALHYNSQRSDKPFVAVNIAAIPKELIESELFGHEKGAFTGAVSTRKGKFEEAHKGTLFLDEIGEMDINLQSKLLRALQEREITRVGGNKVIQVDVRVIVATHRNLSEEVKAGNFREDLYYRLLGLPIELPPLRDRGNDILLLAKGFLEAFCAENQMGAKRLSNAAQKKLLNYHWPGNVRELRAIIELAAVMTEGDVIESDHVNFNNSEEISDVVFEEGTLRDYTCKIIEYFLKKYDNNVVEVAKRLDVGKSTIYRMIKNDEINV
ncbi:MAG: sigma-54 dependent transcriptional regulator [Cryomorphaceae bacterium]|nr:sigma-54 dependent transcriptional regulator [Cryomorphaceae bacterium]